LLLLRNSSNEPVIPHSLAWGAKKSVSAVYRNLGDGANFTKPPPGELPSRNATKINRQVRQTAWKSAYLHYFFGDFGAFGDLGGAKKNFAIVLAAWG